MSKKILIATGGTGGHIYPAVALAQQLCREVPKCQILFVGGGLADNRYFDKHAFASRTINCGAFTNKSPWPLLKSLLNIGKGIWQSRSLIQDFCPDVAVGFGSYYSFPPLIAAKLMGVPLVLHEANSIPGKVNRLLSKYATVSGVHFPQTLHLLQGKTIEVGMPLRDGFKRTGFSQDAAKRHYGLNPQAPVVLIFGGSQGAQIINSTAFTAIKKSHAQTSLQVLHITGNSQVAEELQEAYANAGILAVVKTFESHMATAWQAADIVISRAGAGAIAEQLEFEVPGILIPFARAADNHQEYNANFMVESVGGAIKVVESQLTPDLLSAHLATLLQDVAAQSMRMAMRQYKERSRSRDLCSIIKEVIGDTQVSAKMDLSVALKPQD